MLVTVFGGIHRKTGPDREGFSKFLKAVKTAVFGNQTTFREVFPGTLNLALDAVC